MLKELSEEKDRPTINQQGELWDPERRKYLSQATYKAQPEDLGSDTDRWSLEVGRGGDVGASKRKKSKSKSGGMLPSLKSFLGVK